MISWLDNDFKLLTLEIKMKELKDKFDKTHNESSKDYNLLLNKFLSKKLDKETKVILREQISLISPLIKTQSE